MRRPRQSVFALGLGLGLCAANVMFGLVRLAQPQPDTVRVAAMADETAMSEVGHARTLPEAVAISAA